MGDDSSSSEDNSNQHIHSGHRMSQPNGDFIGSVESHGNIIEELHDEDRKWPKKRARQSKGWIEEDDAISQKRRRIDETEIAAGQHSSALEREQNTSFDEGANQTEDDDDDDEDDENNDNEDDEELEVHEDDDEELEGFAKERSTETPDDYRKQKENYVPEPTAAIVILAAKARRAGAKQRFRLASEPEKRVSDPAYNEPYRELLNRDINDARNGNAYSDRTKRKRQNQPTCIAGSIWTQQEKDAFFRALPVVGKDNVEALAAKVKTKSIIECRAYVLELQKATARVVKGGYRFHKLVSSAHIPAAVEISEKCIQALDVEAARLEEFAVKREMQAEKKGHGDLAVLHGGSGSLRYMLHNEERMKELVEILPAAKLLNLDVLMKVSRIFMLDREDRVVPDARFADGVKLKPDNREPAIRHQAFTDLHNLVVSLTRRLVQVSLYQTNARSQLDPEAKQAKGPVVTRADARAAIMILGLEPTSEEIWRKMPRRYGLKVHEEKQSRRAGLSRRVMDYDEVEKELAVFEEEVAFGIQEKEGKKEDLPRSKKHEHKIRKSVIYIESDGDADDDQNGGNESDRELLDIDIVEEARRLEGEEAMDGKVARKASQLQSRRSPIPQATTDEQRRLEGSVEEDGTAENEPPLAALSAVPTVARESPIRIRLTRLARETRSVQQEEAYLESIDQLASLEAERSLWAILGADFDAIIAPLDTQILEHTLAAKPQMFWESEAELQDWRDETDVPPIWQQLYYPRLWEDEGRGRRKRKEVAGKSGKVSRKRTEKSSPRRDSTASRSPMFSLQPLADGAQSESPRDRETEQSGSLSEGAASDDNTSSEESPARGPRRLRERREPRPSNGFVSSIEHIPQNSDDEHAHEWESDDDEDAFEEEENDD